MNQCASINVAQIGDESLRQCLNESFVAYKRLRDTASNTSSFVAQTDIMYWDFTEQFGREMAVIARAQHNEAGAIRAEVALTRQRVEADTKKLKLFEEADRADTGAWCSIQ